MTLTMRAFAEAACFCRGWAGQVCSGAWRGLCFSCVGMQAAQAAGGALGTAVALRWVPHDWQGRFRTFDQGPKPGVSLALGVACECILSFAINLVVLWSAHTRWAALRDLSSCAAPRARMHPVFPQEVNGPAKQPCLLKHLLACSNCWAMCVKEALECVLCVHADCRGCQPFAHRTSSKCLMLRRHKRLGFIAPLAATVPLVRPHVMQCTPHPCAGTVRQEAAGSSE